MDVEPCVTVAAVDLGASSGRVMLGIVRPASLHGEALHGEAQHGEARHGEAQHGEAQHGEARHGAVELVEVHRFPTVTVELVAGDGQVGLHWDAVGLYAQVLTGLRRCGDEAARRGWPAPASIGIDSWAVDYGLLDADGALLGTPYCYRDPRTARGVERVHAVANHETLYGVNGLQFLPFNTLYQLAAEQGTARWPCARTMLLLPDLLAHWLTGTIGAEVTNASTTGLLDVRTGSWATGLAAGIAVPPALLPALRQPGDVLGPLLPHVAAETGLPTATVVTAVGSHDTASAVVGTPAQGDRFGYIASGTWSLVGLELPAPVLSEASRAANFTNEGGVDGRIRYLRNVMGLWLLSESLRVWERAGAPTDLEHLLAAAAQVRPLDAPGAVIDVDDARFLPPGDMPARIEAVCRESGIAAPQGRPAMVRCILDSLAVAYSRALDDAVRLSGRPVDVVHVVGGGSRNALLCRLTARATGRPVLAGPVEATALGNVLVQARSLGVLTGDLDQLRGVARTAEPLQRYDP